MASGKLRIGSRPRLSGGRLLLAFTGWMDGGDVSTGTVQRFVDELDATPIGEIESEGFYIYNFPGDMEVSALFRPHIKIEEGVVQKFEIPRNMFYASADRKIAFFIGKEPNLNWKEFGQCVFDFAAEFEIASIYFVGSFAGTVPHTREPRLHVSVSDPRLKDRLKHFGLRPTNYEGPGSFMTYLTSQAGQRGIDMANIVAEIPAYLKGTNPLSIEAVTRHLAAILGIEVNLSALRTTSNEWTARVTKVVQEDDDMANQIREMEKQYDDDLIEAEAGYDSIERGFTADDSPLDGVDDDEPEA